MVTDSISDLLTRIRNAQARKKPKVVVPYSKMVGAILDILKKEKFIEDFEVSKEEERPQQEAKLILKYVNDQGAIEKLIRVSRPGVRQYVGYREIPKVLNGLGIAILSTPEGVLTGKEARARKVGGELLCKVW